MPSSRSQSCWLCLTEKVRLLLSLLPVVQSSVSANTVLSSFDHAVSNLSRVNISWLILALSCCRDCLE